MRDEKRIIGAVLQDYERYLSATYYYAGEEQDLVKVLSSRDPAKVKGASNYEAKLKVRDVICGGEREIGVAVNAAIVRDYKGVAHPNVTYYIHKEYRHQSMYRASEAIYIGPRNKREVIKTSLALKDSPCFGRLSLAHDGRWVYKAFGLKKWNTGRYSEGGTHWFVNNNYITIDADYEKRMAREQQQAARRKASGEIRMSDVTAVFDIIVEMMRPAFGKEIGRRLSFATRWNDRLKKEDYLQYTPALYKSAVRLNMASNKNKADLHKQLGVLKPFLDGMIANKKPVYSAYGLWVRRTLVQTKPRAKKK